MGQGECKLCGVSDDDNERTIVVDETRNARERGSKDQNETIYPPKPVLGRVVAFEIPQEKKSFETNILAKVSNAYVRPLTSKSSRVPPLIQANPIHSSESNLLMPTPASGSGSPMNNWRSMSNVASDRSGPESPMNNWRSKSAELQANLKIEYRRIPPPSQANASYSSEKTTNHVIPSLSPSSSSRLDSGSPTNNGRSSSNLLMPTPASGSGSPMNNLRSMSNVAMASPSSDRSGPESPNNWRSKSAELQSNNLSSTMNLVDEFVDEDLDTDGMSVLMRKKSLEDHGLHLNEVDHKALMRFAADLGY